MSPQRYYKILGYANFPASFLHFHAFLCIFSCLANEQRTNKSQIWPFLCHLSDFRERIDKSIAKQRPNDCKRAFTRYANEEKERWVVCVLADRLFSVCTVVVIILLC